MDLATIIGFLGTIGMIAGAMISAGGLGSYIDVPSILIVFGGSFFAVMYTAPLPVYLGSFGAFIGYVGAIFDDLESIIKTYYKVGDLIIPELDVQKYIDMVMLGVILVVGGIIILLSLVNLLDRIKEWWKSSFLNSKVKDNKKDSDWEKNYKGSKSSTDMVRWKRNMGCPHCGEQVKVWQKPFQCVSCKEYLPHINSLIKKPKEKQLYELIELNGKPYTKFTKWTEEDKIYEEVLYEEDDIIRSKVFYPSGSLFHERIVEKKDSFTINKDKTFYENGQLKKDEIFKNNFIYHGRQKFWYKDGVKKKELNYVDGKKNGYEKNGML